MVLGELAPRQSVEVNLAGMDDAARELLDQFKQQLWRINVQRSRDQGAALHKPLLMLVVLSWLENGAERNWLEFREVENAFRTLWPRFGGRDSDADPAMPYFHLRAEPFWRLHGVADASSPPPLAQLRADTVHAELVPDALFSVLRSVRAARLESAEVLFDRWWPHQVGRTLASDLKLARTYRLLVVDPDNFEVCVQSGTWGAQSETALRKYEEGDVLLFHLTKGSGQGGGLCAMGTVLSPVYYDASPMWQDMSGRAYPHRIKFHLVARLDRPLPTKDILQRLRPDAPRNWFHGFIQASHSLSLADGYELQDALEQALGSS